MREVRPEAWPPARPTCARCRRPLRVCYCAALPTLATRTRIVILQHPREKDMPIGTARMAQLCLPEAELHVGIRWGESAAFQQAIRNAVYPTGHPYRAGDSVDSVSKLS